MQEIQASYNRGYRSSLSVDQARIRELQHWLNNEVEKTMAIRDIVRRPGLLEGRSVDEMHRALVQIKELLG